VALLVSLTAGPSSPGARRGPLRQVAATARRIIDEDDFSARIPNAGPEAASSPSWPGS
jgi:hypothetical protein